MNGNNDVKLCITAKALKLIPFVLFLYIEIFICCPYNKEKT